MRGFFVLMLIGVALGAALVTFMMNNPGYALIVLGGYRLEASPYALILVIATITLCLFLVLRVVSQLLGILPGLGQWWRYRRQQQEHAQVREALLELIEERYSAFDSSIPKLQKSGWLSDSAALNAQRLSLRRRLTSASSVDQIKKHWRKSSQVFRSEAPLQLVYARCLSEKGGARDAESALNDLATTAWNQEATELLSMLTLEDPRTLLTRLEALRSSPKQQKAIDQAKQALAARMAKAPS